MSDNTFTLTELQYAQPVKGDRFRLYIYGEDGKHNGRIYFRETPNRKNGEVDISDAACHALVAVGAGKEIRVTDSGDMLLYRITTGPHGEVCENYPPGEGVLSFFRRLQA